MKHLLACAVRLFSELVHELLLGRLRLRQLALKLFLQPCVELLREPSLLV